MNISELREQFGDYAKDIKLNLSTVLTEEGAPGLNTKQIYCIALASAYAKEQAMLIAALQQDAKNILSAEEIQATRAATTIMAMNNIYYRFTHLISDKEYSTMPAKLRMNVMANPGIEKIDFELISLAVSAINGCGMCMDSHVHQLIKAGVAKLAIQSAVRIAAVIHAAAQALFIQSTTANTN